MKLATVLASVGALGAAVACSSASTSNPSLAHDAGGSPVSDAPDTDTWDNWGLQFFTTYCVECHAANNPKGLNFGSKSIVVANADTIRCGVCVQQQASWNCPAGLSVEQFPISDATNSNPKPSDAERDRVVAWIDAGCP